MQSGQPQRKDPRHPAVDQEPFNLTVSQSGTSYAGSTIESEHRRQTAEEDEHTIESVYTYHSGPEAERFTRSEQGRIFNTLSDIYYMPSDDDEWERLDKRHVALAIALGGLYPAQETVNAILAPEPGEKKRVLDLGCGTGTWCIEMAKKFPHAQVVGVDLMPVPVPAGEQPPNCQFEIDNINLGLGHFHNQFDVVHCRIIGFGIQDHKKTMEDVEKCLKPGGIVIWLEGEYEAYQGWPAVYRPPYSSSNPDGKYIVRIGYETRRAAVKNGSDLRNMERAVDEGLWTHEYIDPATCKTASLHLVVGDWMRGPDFNSTQRLRYIGALMRQDFRTAIRSLVPVLAKVGWPQETLDHWLVRSDEECQKDPISLRVGLAWGRRRAGPGMPAPPLTVAFQQEPVPPTPCICYEEYSTREEALEKAERRNQGKDFPELPLPPLGQELA